MKPMIALLVILFSNSAFSQQAARPDSLLDHMVGKWTLEGIIDGRKTTHDITADWVLAEQYVQFHEISREKDSTGRAAYEAIVTIGWDRRLKQYGVFWLDITGEGAFAEQGIGRGTPQGNEIPFLFTFSDTSHFHTTFAYDADTDSWRWMMDDEENGKLQPFARVTLTRKR